MGAARLRPRARPRRRRRPEKPRALSANELREQALLAMCIAAPAYGRDYLERLKGEHLSSPEMRRVRDWLAGHLEHPREGLPRDDEELADAVTQLVVRAQREPASPEAMELNFLLLEKAAVERRDRGRRGERGRAAGRAPEAPRGARRTDRPSPKRDAKVTEVIRTHVRVFRPIRPGQSRHGQGSVEGVLWSRDCRSSRLARSRTATPRPSATGFRSTG